MWPERDFPHAAGYIRTACNAASITASSTPLLHGHSVSSNDLRTLLDRIRGIRHACDLDLLLFFFRHPCALLTSEQIVAFLGYDRERVGKSLDGLIDAGLLTRSQNPAHAARLYTLQLHARPGGLLSSLLKLAATRQGRHDVMRLLESESTPGPGAGPRRSAPILKIA